LNNLCLTEQNIVDEDSYHSFSIGHGTAHNLISMGPLVSRGSAERAVPVGTPISRDNVPAFFGSFFFAPLQSKKQERKKSQTSTSRFKVGVSSGSLLRDFGARQPHNQVGLGGVSPL
jgi:hypothetical protein